MPVLCLSGDAAIINIASRRESETIVPSDAGGEKKEPKIFGNNTNGCPSVHCPTLLSEAGVQEKKQPCKCVEMKIDGTQIFFFCDKQIFCPQNLSK